MPKLYRSLMLETRSLEPEIMDEPDPPPEVARKFHRDLKRIHALMGNWRVLVSRLKRGEQPLSVIDIGCGDGALLAYLRQELNLSSVTGVDLKPPGCVVSGVSVITGDATCDPLPRADAAVCLMVLHHLTDEQAIALFRNLASSVKRVVCVDPVRHWVPMLLYAVLLCPILSPVGAADGKQSIRRSFKPEELRKLAQKALAGRAAKVSVNVTPFFTKLILEIEFQNYLHSPDGAARTC